VAVLLLGAAGFTAATAAIDCSRGHSLGAGLLGLGLVSSALGGIFSAAVYSYATTGSAGQFFRESLLDLIVDLRALPHRPIKKSADCPKSFKREGCLSRV